MLKTHREVPLYSKSQVFQVWIKLLHNRQIIKYFFILVSFSLAKLETATQ